jgi:hypothetical protein
VVLTGHASGLLASFHQAYVEVRQSFTNEVYFVLVVFRLLIEKCHKRLLTVVEIVASVRLGSDLKRRRELP